MRILSGQDVAGRRNEEGPPDIKGWFNAVSLSLSELTPCLQSHKRRAARYAEHLEAHPEVTEETADPRRISAFLDMQLRLRKSGGAGFTINPSATKRKRKRNKVKVGLEPLKPLNPQLIVLVSQTPEERAAAAARAIANGAAPKDGEDGIAVVAGLTALNAKQKRKLRQLENKAKGKEDSASADDAAEEPKEAAIKPKAAAKAPQVAKAGQAKAERPSTSRGSDKSKKKKTVV